MNAPTVSVIIPTYNRRVYVQEAIDSVLAQTFRDFELIVMDDGSFDGTGDALQARYGDRIRYEWQENQGESVARNRGIEMAAGEYVAFLDSDDLWLPEKLERQVGYLDSHPETGAVFCQAIIIDQDGVEQPGKWIHDRIISTDDTTLAALLYTNTVGNPSMFMVRRHLLVAAGAFDPSMRFGEDWDLFIRLRALSPFAQIPEPLCRVRWHRGNQWRLRPWEHIEPTLRDRLRMYEKGFALVPAGDGTYQELRRRVEAREYADAAVAALAWGEYGVASKWLIQAAQADPGRRLEPEKLAYMYATARNEVQQRTAPFSWKQIHADLSETLRTLSAAQFDRRDRRVFARKTRAAVYRTVYIEASMLRDYATVRRALPGLLLAKPDLAFSLGVWWIAFSAVAGEACASRVKTCLRRIGIFRQALGSNEA